MIVFGVIMTVIVGIVGSSIGYEMNFTELGPILSIACMGGFIMGSIRHSNKTK